MRRTALLLLAASALFADGRNKAHPDEVRGELTTAKHADFKPEDIVKGGTAVLPLLSDVDSFNPYLSTSADADNVLKYLYPLPLIEHADYYKGMPTFEADLVDKWRVDGLKLHMHIRDDAVWSDGKPITSADFRFSWEAAKSSDIAWVSQEIVKFQKELEIVNDKNFILHYSQPTIYMVMNAKDWRIIPKHVFGKVPFKEWKSYKHWDELANVVSGPYKVQSYKHNEEFVLVPNEKYWLKDRPRIQKVIFRVINSQQTQIDALFAGEIDSMSRVPPKDIKKILDDPDLRLFTYLDRFYEYVGWNCKHEIFKDPEIRMAMTLAIDRENIAEVNYRGYAKVTASPIISTLWACDKSLEPHLFDPDKAEEILDKKGWKRGKDGIRQKDGKRFEFHLSTNQGNMRRKNTVQMVQADLKEIGVIAYARFLDFNVMIESLRKGKEDAWVAGWGSATYVDPSSIFSTKGIGFRNYAFYSNKRVDELIDQGAGKPMDVAMPIWKEYQQIFHKEQPYTILYEAPGLNAFRKKFENVESNALDVWFNLDEWFIPKGKQLATK
ncbi:MAG: ABC transporter substrate-binding protein [Planctomycetota bacterium]|nr:ABC transporter substrate-binding protein [Planctomycetota bacterium]